MTSDRLIEGDRLIRCRLIRCRLIQVRLYVKMFLVRLIELNFNQSPQNDVCMYVICTFVLAIHSMRVLFVSLNFFLGVDIVFSFFKYSFSSAGLLTFSLYSFLLGKPSNSRLDGNLFITYREAICWEAIFLFDVWGKISVS